MELTEEEKDELIGLFLLHCSELARANNHIVEDSSIEDEYTYNLGDNCVFIPYLPVTSEEALLISKCLERDLETEAANFYKEISNKII